MRTRQMRQHEIEQPDLYHIWHWRLVLPLISELLHHYDSLFSVRNRWWILTHHPYISHFPGEFPRLLVLMESDKKTEVIPQHS
jgi:hypothetical protein